MTAKYFLKQAAQKLAADYPPEERFAIIKQLLLAKTSLSSADILLNASISEQKTELLGPLIARLAQGEPLQYVLGEVNFCNLLLKVKQGVLIPRPETEELVQHICEQHRPEKNLRLLDCGTGSGCIALALARHLQNPQVFATDLSPQALQIAQENARINSLDVQFFIHDLCGSTDLPIAPVDILVSNPPYIPDAERAQMHKNVLCFEPQMALFVSNQNPLLFYRHLLKKGRKWIKPGGKIYMEINQNFAKELVLLAKNLGWQKIICRKDFRSNHRFLEATNPR